MAVINRKVIYSGRVQGVGFRYTARSVAGLFDVAGYVRNLSSGSVELVAEGEAGEVQAFLGRLAREMAGYIVNAEISDHAPQGFAEFRIRH
jgi:acylphosphatase